MSRFSPPERHNRDVRPSPEHAVTAEPAAPMADQERPDKARPPFRRIAILASVPGLSRVG